MVPVILGIDLYELRERIRREIVKRITDLKVNAYPLDSAWLLYALSLNGNENNPFFEQYMDLLERWALSEESGKKDRDMAPLCICGILSTESEIRQVVIRKVKGILERTLPKTGIRFNILNDPEQVFCASILLKNEKDMNKEIIGAIKKSINGRISRKVFFIAGLIEFGENPKDFLEKLKTPQNIEDIISMLWLYERYRNVLDGNLGELWKFFDNIYPSIGIEMAGESSTISNRDLVLLYEAVVRELTEPSPEMLFDLYPIHPEIKKITWKYFKHKKYINAIFETTKKLNELIQDKTGIRNKSEAELVQATMKQIGNPKKLRIIFNEYLSEDAGKNEQKGLALITEGIFSAFRNPKGHKPEDHPLVNVTPYEALGQLIIIDYIWKRIEKAKINKVGDKHA